MEGLVTVEEAAKRIGVTTVWIYNLCRDKKIKFKKTGKKTKILLDSLIGYNNKRIEQQQTKRTLHDLGFVYVREKGKPRGWHLNGKMYGATSSEAMKNFGKGNSEAIKGRGETAAPD